MPSSSKIQRPRKRGARSVAKKSRERTEGSMKTMVVEESTANNKKDKEKAQKKSILGFVARTLKKGPSGLQSDFKGMRRFNDFEKMKVFKSNQENGKNRYKDVGCLDNNRVKLGNSWPHDYIHANYVSTPTNAKRFICTQAPLDKTCADFWFMCLQEGVEVIVMLCNLVEKGAKKCAEYYPTKEKPVVEFEEKGMKVIARFESSGAVKFDKKTDATVVETVISVEGPNGMALRTTHYHWIDWPDRGVPTADVAICELLAKARPTKGPIVVHCSAGIGRTGAVVMIEYILDQVLSAQPIEESTVILQKIRDQRNNSIQTDAQYLFVHEVILNYFEERKMVPVEINEAHASFTASYMKALPDK